MTKKAYDIAVIGAGPGGYVASIIAAQKGMSVVNIEEKATLGGTCLNVGCIPSKSLLHASEQYENNVCKSRNSDWGIDVKKIDLNIEKMMHKKTEIIGELTSGIDFLFKKNKISRLIGKAKIKKDNQIEISLAKKIETLSAKKIIIATGSKPSVIKNIEIDENRILSSTGALELKKVPKKMVIVGAGVIGLEMGTIWRRLGSEVEIIEFQSGILNGMDLEITDKFKKILEKQGLKFRLNTSVINARVTGKSVDLELKKNDEKKTEVLKCNKVLVATGRIPNTESLGLKEIGVKLDKNGFISVSEKFETSRKDIYAIGDVINGPMLAHKAEEDARALIEMINGESGHIDYNLVPNIIYTSPEVASIGLNEEQIQKSEIDYNKGIFPFMANSRAKAIGHTDGFVKILSDKKTDRILGAHIIGHEAGTIIHELCFAMGFGASSEDVSRICHGHPTVNEAIKEAALATYSNPIHS